MARAVEERLLQPHLRPRPRRPGASAPRGFQVWHDCLPLTTLTPGAGFLTPTERCGNGSGTRYSASRTLPARARVVLEGLRTFADPERERWISAWKSGADASRLGYDRGWSCPAAGYHATRQADKERRNMISRRRTNGGRWQLRRKSHGAFGTG